MRNTAKKMLAMTIKVRAMAIMRRALFLANISILRHFSFIFNYYSEKKKEIIRNYLAFFIKRYISNPSGPNRNAMIAHICAGIPRDLLASL